MSCILGGMAYGQGVYEAWVARYDGPGSADQAEAIAIDDSGNVYVTGFTPGTGNDDFATIKYAANGDSLWLRRYNGPGNSRDRAHALTVDNFGNVYVIGDSWNGADINFATIKYAPNGDSLWAKLYNGPGNNSDEVAALVVDDSGNVYVTGSSIGSLTSYDYATIKYAPNGDTVWVRLYNGPGNDVDRANALVLDDSGNVYVTGVSWNGADIDFATIKYTPNGDTAWTRYYNGPSNSSDVALALALDKSGNVYVAGYSDSTGTGYGYDFVAIKYAPNGDSLWVRRYNGPGIIYEQALSLALDQSGNLYVAGTSYASETSYDYATIKYAPNGDTLWVRRYNGPSGNGWDHAIALCSDEGGNAYVTGTSWSGSSSDYCTIKYSPNGDTFWVKRCNNGAEDYVSALAVDTSGNLYVTGRSFYDGAGYDYTTIKYSPCSSIPGDVNSTGDITLGDIIHVVNYIFDKDKLPCLGIDPGNCWTPDPFCRGDVNISGAISLGDIIHLVNYIFDKDRLPCLGSNPGNCWTPEASGACCLAVP